MSTPDWEKLASLKDDDEIRSKAMAMAKENYLRFISLDKRTTRMEEALNRITVSLQSISRDIEELTQTVTWQLANRLEEIASKQSEPSSE